MTENVCAEEAFDTFLKPYSAILVDEAHLLSVEQLKILEECKKQIPIIFSSDTEDMISPEELDREISQRLASLPDVQNFLPLFRTCWICRGEKGRRAILILKWCMRMMIQKQYV